MERNMELVREVLQKVKADGKPRGWINEISIPGWTDEQISYHIELLSEAGFLHGFDVSAQNDYCWKAGNLTWQGHEFLDTITNQTVWNRLMSKLQDKGGSASFEVVKALAIEISKQYFLEG